MNNLLWLLSIDERDVCIGAMSEEDSDTSASSNWAKRFRAASISSGFMETATPEAVWNPVQNFVILLHYVYDITRCN